MNSSTLDEILRDATISMDFQILEVWSDENGSLNCVSSYFQSVLGDKPVLADHSVLHSDLSQAIIEIVAQSSSDILWRNDDAIYHTNFPLPVRTEIAYKIIIPDNSSVLVYLLGYSLELKLFTSSNHRTLSQVKDALTTSTLFQIHRDLSDHVAANPELDQKQHIMKKSDSIADDTVSALKFNYSLRSLPVQKPHAAEVIFEDIKSLSHLTDGSNSNIFLGFYKSRQVIVKIVKEEMANESVALDEFNIEYSILRRLNHPNIVDILGGGQVVFGGRNMPRRFIVVEFLNGGTLDVLLQKYTKKKSIFFRRLAFTFIELLTLALELASALKYLHSLVHPDATIIHRDLKPENIGFDSHGTLKLIDFGLCTCVCRRNHSEQTYELSGNTGSLRYMAPEVALRQPYSEMVDVYSFGVLLWQMATNEMPYKGLSRSQFMTRVVGQGERPKIERKWPLKFGNLLQSCWHTNPDVRPSFDTITLLLEEIRHDEVDYTNRSFSTVLPRVLRSITPPIPTSVTFTALARNMSKSSASLSEISENRSKSSWF